MEEKIIIMHGFEPEEAAALMRTVKTALPSAKDAAFAMSTPANLEWKLRDLLDHIGEEHQRFRNAKDGKA